MSWGKYRRLLAVSFIPLLIIGALVFTFGVKPPSDVSILCTPITPTSENCRNTGHIGNSWEKELIKEYGPQFDIKFRPFEKNSLPYMAASGTHRLITGVKILEVSPYAGTDDSPGSPTARLRALKGQDISIEFGGEESAPRVFNPLGCNELDLDGDGVSYTAGLCGVPNGVVLVKFSAGPESSAQLSALKQAVDYEATDARRNLILHYALGTPIFLVLFLLASGLIWGVKRAGRYVAAG